MLLPEKYAEYDEHKRYRFLLQCRKPRTEEHRKKRDQYDLVIPDPPGTTSDGIGTGSGIVIEDEFVFYFWHGIAVTAAEYEDLSYESCEVSLDS